MPEHKHGDGNPSDAQPAGDLGTGIKEVNQSVKHCQNTDSQPPKDPNCEELSSGTSAMSQSELSTRKSESIDWPSVDSRSISLDYTRDSGRCDCGARFHLTGASPKRLLCNMGNGPAYHDF